MNFLELVQRVRREAGISGSGPVTTTGQTGEMLRITDWVRDAYFEIQNAQPRWNWLFKTAEIDVGAGEHTYHPVTGWGIYPLEYDTTSFRLYAISDGPEGSNTSLAFLKYATAKLSYFNQTTQRPSAFTVKPTREIQFNTRLDQDYHLTFDYYATAESLESDTDVPSMPEQYHLSVVWKALGYYADYEEVPYLMQRSMQKFSDVYNQMLSTETPKIEVAGPLV